jgi:hypothetical protein
VPKVAVCIHTVAYTISTAAEALAAMRCCGVSNAIVMSQCAAALYILLTVSSVTAVTTGNNCLQYNSASSTALLSYNVSDDNVLLKQQLPAVVPLTHCTANIQT